MARPFRTALVGRDRELRLVLDRMAGADAGAGQVVLVAGEPGIGKSRLAEEVAARAVELNLRSVWCRATDDNGSPPYWLLSQALRALSDPAAVRGLFDPAPVSAVDSSTAAEARRFQMFSALADALVGAAAERGLLLVLDDLQWADAPSLAALVHLVRSMRLSRLMVLATYRDTEVVGRVGLTTTLAALAQEPSVTRLRLTGLAPAAVAEQLAELTGAAMEPEVVSVVSRRSQGNPFFVAELGRLLDVPGSRAEAELPGAVRDALRARLGRLGVSCREIVIAAAVLGADLSVDALAEITGTAVEDVLAAQDEAAEAGLVARCEQWQFAHDLIRETARLEQPTAARLALYARMADYLENVNAGPAEVAHHLLESLPVGNRARAVEWAERAATTAMEQLAWEDAAEFYRRSLTAGAVLTSADSCRLHLGRGTALLKASHSASAQSALREAAAAARATGDPVALAGVALAMEGVTDPSWSPTGQAICDDALAALPPEDSPLRARLLAQRAMEAAFEFEPELRPCSELALAMAERTGDEQALRAALRARQLARSGPDGIADRLALSARLIGLDHGEGDDAVLWGRLWRFDALLQRGDLDAAEAELEPIEAAADRLRLPLARWQALRSAAAMAMVRGRFDEASRYATRCMDLLDRAGNDPARMVTAIQLLVVSTQTGSAEGLDERVEQARRRGPLPSPGPASLYLREHRHDEARRHYDAAAAAGPIAGTWLLESLAAFAELAAAFEDRDTAAVVYRRLSPFADLFVSGGAGAIVIFGSTRRFLGIAAATMGRLNDAVNDLRAAVAANDRAGAVPWAAIARLDLARVLARRRRPGDRDEAEALATVAASTAAALGMAPLLDETRALLADLLEGAGPLTKRESEIATLVAQGLTNRQIAAAAHISERTAESHVQHILRKLGYTTRSQIAAWVAGSARHAHRNRHTHTA
jgi:DNA-binding CsgD family transcriptional regulator